MANGTKTIKVDVSETERILCDYVLSGIARELDDYANRGKLPHSTRLFGIANDIHFIEEFAEELESEEK